MLELVETLKGQRDETIEIHVSPELAAAIARIDARECGSLTRATTRPTRQRP